MRQEQGRRPRSEAASPPEAGAQRAEGERRQAPARRASEGGPPQYVRTKSDGLGVVEREAEVRDRALCAITLLRHGEPAWAPDVENPGLTPRGEEQERAAAQALARRKVDAIYVSPLCRAQESARPLAEKTGLEPVTIKGLAEIRVRFAGMTREQVEQFFAQAIGRPLREHWDGWPGGESFRDFHKRVTGGLHEVLARHEVESERIDEFEVWHVPPRRQSIVIVAHGGTNSVVLAHLLGVRPVPWEWTRFDGALAGYSTLSTRSIGERGHVWSLESFNDVAHLSLPGQL